MSERVESKVPFVGLHAHSGLSLFDGLGYPQEHMKFAHQNGCDALALTDHGHMNGLSHQVLFAKKMKEQGQDFKPIFGVEAYFNPSIKQWREEYKTSKEANKKAKATGAVIEDENASKRTKSVLNKRNHLILLAMNQTGLNNIFKLISESFRDENFYRYPRLDYDLLADHAEGVIAASACLGGVYAGDYWDNKDAGPDRVMDAMRLTTKRMQSIFGDRWYGELQWNNIPEQHDLNKYIIEISKEFDMKLISTADSHYPNPDAWRDRELYKRLGWLGKGGMPEWMSSELPEGVEEIGYELYPKNGDQMWDSYKKYSKSCGVEYDDDLVMESITRTHRIAYDRIESFMPDTVVRLPDFVVPEGKTAELALREFAVDGLKKYEESESLSENVVQEYISRASMELKVIEDRGFTKYFLTMKAIADRASEVQLVGAGRGSAAGSLVSFLIGITQVDPLKYDLLFERFMRKDQKDYPDIDYDVSDPMQLKEMLIEEWGESTVVPISNFNTLKLRSLIKDIAKLYEIPFKEVNPVTSRMVLEATPLAKKKHGIKAGVYAPTFEELVEFSPTLQRFFDKYPNVKTHIEALHGQVRSVSRHAGGIVVGENLDRWMPLINSGGVRQTPWSEGQNVRHLEPLGFIKFDVLGLASLRMMDGAIRHILRRHHGVSDPTFADVKDYYDRNLHPDKIDFDDQEVYTNIFHDGKWGGIFQFTEKGAQKFCMKAKPTSIIDISAITSIYRPGPLSAKVHDLYVSAKNNPDEISYGHDLIRDVTEETYSFLIFQEQIALLAHKLGKDLSLDEGNMLRKLLTKKGTGAVADKKRKIHDKFVSGCVEKGLTPREATELWEKFEYFSGYGFNKSHAVSYSILSYQCAHLLNYYPSEWMAAFLDKEPEGRKEQAINIAKSMGFKLTSLDINTSGRVWEISEDGKTLIPPLNSIKGLGAVAIDQIIEHRPFKDAEDLLFRKDVSYSKLNKKALDVLARGQALTSLVDERFTGLKHFWSVIAVDRPKSLKKFKENMELYAPEGEFMPEEQIEHLVSLTGVFPFRLVMGQHITDELNKHMVPPIGEWDNDLGVAWFIPREVIEKKTKNGRTYWIVKVIDSSNKSTAIKCWAVKQGSDRVFINRPYMAKLDYDEQWGFSTRSIRYNFKLLA
jgi:DNA polymerase-3 subunit alpha